MVNQMRKMFSIVVVLFAVSAVNVKSNTYYDTSWTYVYDGGMDSASGKVYQDRFFDVKALPDGSCICIGSTGFSNSLSLLMKLDPAGKLILKKIFITNNENDRYNRESIHSLTILKNGDLIVGGERYLEPWIMRLDSAGNVKWHTWYFDSINDNSLLQRSATINCLRETRRGTIVCAAGDVYPNNNGLTLQNYAAFMEFDSTGNVKRTREWKNVSGYTISGFDIEETEGGEYLFSGNQAVFYLDTVARPVWQKAYSYQLEGVGAEVATICRAKVLRGNIPMVEGRVYEGNCWTKYNQLYYDAWWSPISYSDGSYKAWDTAGKQGTDDYLYDFTQLINGNIVFVGVKGGGNGNFPVWIIVADSTGKQPLWEKEFAIQKSSSISMLPYSVCATADSGFTVVGKGVFDSETGDNAFAMHFVPTSGMAVSRVPYPTPKAAVNTCKIIGKKAVFSFANYTHFPERISIYSVDGRLVRDSPISGMRKSADSFEWDLSGIGKGVYLYAIKAEQSLYSGRVVVGK